jgi:type II secretory pathway predicted ATPase ExeA
MPKKTEKKFDSVQMMREARDRISRDIAGMTFEQEKAYIRERLQRASEGKESHPQEHAA